MEEAHTKLDKIIKRANKFGLSTYDVAGLATNKVICKQYGAKHIKKMCAGVVLFAGLVLGYLFDLKYDDQCWITMPRELAKAFRPPEDCSICRGLTSVERVSEISPAEFEEKYAYTGIPVVVSDGTTNWSAMEIFNFWFFKDLYEDAEYWSTSRDCQFFPYRTEFKSLLEALNMSKERAELQENSAPWYIGWSNCQDGVAKILRQHYGRPYFLPETSENNPVDWIFMGGPGHGAQMHVDNVIYPSWQAQIKGSKRWILAPPPECFYSCQWFAVDVLPGDIIVLDTNRWYHQTNIIPGEISITIGAEFD